MLLLPLIAFSSTREYPALVLIQLHDPGTSLPLAQPWEIAAPAARSRRFVNLGPCTNSTISQHFQSITSQTDGLTGHFPSYRALVSRGCVSFQRYSYRRIDTSACGDITEIAVIDTYSAIQFTCRVACGWYR